MIIVECVFFYCLLFLMRAVVKYTPDQIRKMEESIRIRRANEPMKLLKLVKTYAGF